MSRSLYENRRGSPTLTLLNVLGVLNVLKDCLQKAGWKKTDKASLQNEDKDTIPLSALRKLMHLPKTMTFE